jgi:demethylmenaquinone methyltransferase/2-methoxy-6-polyprenyl-1,4-benzoquinol methylase
MPFDHFSFIAPVYARLGEYRELDALLRLADLPAAGRLLDLGGGTGRVARSLASHAQLTVVADVSFDMLRYAGATAGLQALGSASENLPFPDEAFARVIMIDALHHVEDQPATAREMWRILQKGGVLVIVEPDIRTFAVKLIALAEKLLLMRSHFLAPEEILSLFPLGAAEAHAQRGSAWIVIRKPS